MVRVQIIASREDIDAATKAVLSFSQFQPEEPKYPISITKLEYARLKLPNIIEHISKIEMIMDLGGLVRSTYGRMDVTNWLNTTSEVEGNASKIEEKYSNILQEVGKIEAELESTITYIKELEPIKDITVPLEALYNSRLFDILIGKIDKEKFETINQNDDLAIYYVEGGKELYVMIIGESNSVQIKKIIESGVVKKIDVPEELPRVPSEAYNFLLKRKSELESALNSIKGRASADIRKDKELLYELYGKLLTVRDALTLLSKARVSEYFVQIEGYIPKKFEKKLREGLNKVLSGEFQFSVEWPKRYSDEEPPSLVSLPKGLKPLASLVEMYGSPSYWEFAPTAFLIITFPIFFGLMFPDFGNALVLFVFAIWFYRYGKRKGSENIVDLSLVLIYASIAAMVTGLIARAFFGPLPVGGLRELDVSNSVGPLYSIWPLPVSVPRAIYFLLPFGEYSNPLISVPDAIILSVGIGTIVLFLSSLIGVLNAAKKRDLEYLIYEKLPYVIIYAAPFILFMYGFSNISTFFTNIEQLLGGIEYAIIPSGSPPPTATLARVLVWLVIVGLLYNWGGKAAITKTVEKQSTLTSIIFGFIEGAFEGALLLLSNTISFIRILVFAMSHYYILFAFSYMGYLVAGSPSSTLSVLTNPLAILVIIIGNLLAIALEGLVVFIQDLRLHFYEMFGKFYEGKGRKFEPVSTYVELI
ncbi:ATP synthase subunit I [Sulfolobales archaeon HS-7]|nr:ATP synthase subunit I [Sulfolobales archaeon HS-7]